MEKNTKNRVALLGALLITGMVLAGMGTALGVGELFRGIGKTVSVVATGDQVTIYAEGKVVHNFTLPEGEEFAWGISDGAIRVFSMTEEEKERRQAEHEAELNSSLRSVKGIADKS
ncbi:MAG: hypothetical protein KAV25_04800 [Methanophagales archaeon]|nr:hypothetical protein [Methanophagales archaeon]